MKVGIVAVSQTPFGEQTPWRPQELTFLAVKQALEKVGLGFREDYEFIVTCSSDHWDGKTLSDVEHGEVAGAHLGPGEVKVAMDGANAVLLGAIKILSGRARKVVVTACCKETQVLDPCVIENFGFSVPYQQLLGLDFIQAGALQASAYMHRYGLQREDLARVVVAERNLGLANPRMLKKEKLTLGEVMAAKMLAFPITEQELRPACDGACAMILADEEAAKELTDRPVWITGFGSCYENHNLGDRDLAEAFALTKAAQQAIDMAGIGNPVQDIDLLEISEHYSYQLPLWLEALGFCEKGNGPGAFSSSKPQSPFLKPVNPSGGLLCGVPRYVAGANRVLEAFLQLRGEAAGVQVEGEPMVALAHGTYGPAAQHHCVIILERGF